MHFPSKSLKKVVMGAFDVSLIILQRSFSTKWLSIFSYTETNIKHCLSHLSCLKTRPHDKFSHFFSSIQIIWFSMTLVIFDLDQFCCFERGIFNYFYFANCSKYTFIFYLKQKLFKNLA